MDALLFHLHGASLFSSQKSLALPVLIIARRALWTKTKTRILKKNLRPAGKIPAPHSRTLQNTNHKV
jgi:hypothetical protein